MARKVKTWSSGAKRPGRFGKRVTLDLDPALHTAIAGAAHDDGNRPLVGMIARMCREWLAGTGQVEGKRQLIPIPITPKKGRPKKNAAVENLGVAN